MIDHHEYAETVASTVEWLAGTLAMPPSMTDIEKMRSPAGLALLDAIDAEFGCHDAVARIRALLDTSRSAQTVSLDIAVSYTRLFEGVAGGSTVSLYESAYAGEMGASRPRRYRLFGHAVEEMGELLQRFSLSIGRSCEPPDHVSIELSLYAALLRRGDHEGGRLVLDRLHRWLPSCLAACRRHDPLGFYGAVAQMLEILLRSPALTGAQGAVSSSHIEEGSHYAD